MNQHLSFSKQMQFQRGQAMVEYAILFILLSILFIGGAELGMAALASYKNTDAAKTGISEYAEVNQRRLNILNAEKQYLLSLKATCPNVYAKDSDNDGEMDIDSNGFRCSVDGDYKLSFNDYATYLDYIHDQDIINGLADYALRDDSDGELNDYLLPEYDLDSDGVLNDDELVSAEALLNNSQLTIASEIQEKYLRLLLIQHIKLSRLPLKIGEKLSQSKIAIGDHASNLIQQPNCNAGIYDDGLPNDRYIYREYYDNTGNRHIFQTGSVVYLFNPLPINTASCQTITSGLSTLVAGYTPPQSSINSVEDFENNFVAGLPKLNQAMYGMYKSDLSGNLIPPGKMCKSDDDCPNQPNEDLYIGTVGPSGYYRWNKGSDESGTQDLFKYTINNVNDDLLSGFRPAMQIDCNESSNHEESVINDIDCQTLHSKVRIHTRYRKIFEGFLTFGLQELNVADGDLENALKLFYNPNNVGVAGSNQVNGTIDSEIGSLGANGIPTVKRHKDFRGCYEVDVETNQISACN